MPVFNYATRELVLKIVYYGPALGGKTTNLEYIYAQLPPDKKGKMLSLATESDRTLFFDFLPIELGTLQGWKVRIQLYTVPGQVFYDATRRLVLKGADGVVFVVDSQKEMLESNLESWENMKTNLAYNNLDFWTIPLVIQYNKRDLKNILPIPTLEVRINERNVPYFEAVAVRGIGVMETLREAVKLTLLAVQRRITARPEAVTGTPSEVSPARVEPPPPPLPPSPPPPPPPSSFLQTPRLSEAAPTGQSLVKPVAPVAEPEPAPSDDITSFESVEEMSELQPIEEVMAETPPGSELSVPSQVPPEKEPVETLETRLLEKTAPPYEEAVRPPAPPEEVMAETPPGSELSVPSQVPPEKEPVETLETRLLEKTAPPYEEAVRPPAPPSLPESLSPVSDLSISPSFPEVPAPMPIEAAPSPRPAVPRWAVDTRSEPVTVEVTSTAEGLHIRLTLHITLHLITQPGRPTEGGDGTVE